MISTSLVCSRDKREGKRPETDIKRLVSWYTNTDSADTAPLFIWGDDPERYPIICRVRVYESISYWHVSTSHNGHSIDCMIVGLYKKT